MCDVNAEVTTVDPELQRRAGDSVLEPASTSLTWKVLVVDDDPDVYVATELALRDLPVEGRPVTLLRAESAAQALQVIRAEPDLAAVLLDVVMETPDAGLRLVRQIRKQLGRQALRIVLRTGQPGYAPEIETLRAYDINDYRTKSELTRVRLFSTLTVAIRSYAQLTDVIGQRDVLARLNAELLEARAAERAEAVRRHMAEQALRNARETVEQCVEQRTLELSQAVSELDSFNRMVSHDLRGPLHGLADLSRLIQGELERADPADTRRRLALIEKQTRRLAHLVDDLMTLGHVSRDALECEPTPLEALARDAMQTLMLGSAQDRLADVVIGPLPTLPVEAGLLRQVFINLLSNALKFTRDTVAPRIEVLAERGDDGWTVAVRDNGVGFDVAQAPELFKPFKRFHGACYEGSGIGLTIAKRIVERHGGRIWADGRPGHGATFRFTLPAPP
jgi:signal transduction histidine kinase